MVKDIFYKNYDVTYEDTGTKLNHTICAHIDVFYSLYSGGHAFRHGFGVLWEDDKTLIVFQKSDAVKYAEAFVNMIEKLKPRRILFTRR